MKKTYQNPTIEMVTIETHQILAASVEATINGSQSNEAALGRDFDFDDDED
ncbi:MAG: hypothetical protein IJ155_00045 [Prevotella sp.]|nr:hypothetical protein [Prevotella sp.]